jgi:hypothetical protein
MQPLRYMISAFDTVGSIGCKRLAGREPSLALFEISSSSSASWDLVPICLGSTNAMAVPLLMFIHMLRHNAISNRSS